MIINLGSLIFLSKKILLLKWFGQQTSSHFTQDRRYVKLVFQEKIDTLQPVLHYHFVLYKIKCWGDRHGEHGSQNAVYGRAHFNFPI